MFRGVRSAALAVGSVGGIGRGPLPCLESRGRHGRRTTGLVVPSVHVEVVLRYLGGVNITTPATRTDSTGYGRGGRRDLVVASTSSATG